MRAVAVRRLTSGALLSLAMAVALLLGAAQAGAAGLKLGPASLKGATATVSYHQILKVQGGTAPYKFSVSSGTLPAGLELTESGQLIGTPTKAGTSSFSVTVLDSSSPAFSRTREYTLPVQLGLTPRSLPKGVVGAVYNEHDEIEDFSAQGGEGPYHYEIVSGELPPGLRLEGDDIYGTPEAEGVYSFLLKATDSSEQALAGTRRYSIRIKGGSGLPLGAWRLEWAYASEPLNPNFDGITIEANGKLKDEDGAPGTWVYKAGHVRFTIEVAPGASYEYEGTGSSPNGPFSGTWKYGGTTGTFSLKHE